MWTPKEYSIDTRWLFNVMFAGKESAEVCGNARCAEDIKRESEACDCHNQVGDL